MGKADQYPVESSLTGDSFSPTAPIWVSHTTISGCPSKLYLNETEVFSRGAAGKQELNPLIYYRVNKPVEKDLIEELPSLDLDKYFKRAGGLLKFRFDRKEIS